MIRHSFYIEQYKWRLTTFFEACVDDAGEILWHLRRLHSPLWVLKESAVNLTGAKANNGITYSSERDRETIMVLGKASCGAEFFNSLWHEFKHMEEQTAPLLGIDPESEEAAYFRGGIAREIFPFISKLLCECCRTKLGLNSQQQQ